MAISISCSCPNPLLSLKAGAFEVLSGESVVQESQRFVAAICDTWVSPEGKGFMT